MNRQELTAGIVTGDRRHCRQDDVAHGDGQRRSARSPGRTRGVPRADGGRGSAPSADQRWSRSAPYGYPRRADTAHVGQRRAAVSRHGCERALPFAHDELPQLRVGCQRSRPSPSMPAKQAHDADHRMPGSVRSARRDRGSPRRSGRGRR
jgi:hypothetical protein